MRLFLKRFDIRVSLTYAAIATLWIIFSDALLAFLFSGNPQLLLAIGSLKGLGFVTVTALGLYVIISGELRKRNQAEEALETYRVHLEQLVEQRTTELTLATRRVEAILTHSPDGVILVDARLRIQQTNPAFNILLTALSDDYVNQSLLDLFTADDAAHVTAAVHDALAERASRQIETHIRRVNGTSFDAELNIGYVHESENLVCTIRDISERKVREQMLLFHASLQYAVMDAVISTDSSFRIQSWNKAAERMYGWRADEVIGKTSNEVLQTEFLGADRDHLIRELQEQGHIKAEATQHRKDGSVIYVRGSVVLLKDDQGKMLGMVAVNHDITEHRAQERQLRFHASLQESVTDAVIATDMEFRIQSWNRAAETIYGWQAAEVIGKSVADILKTRFESEQVRDRIVEEFLNRGSWRDEYIQYHKNGTEIHILGSTTLFKDDNGQPVGIVTVNNDITQRKKVEAALRLALQKEKELNELKTRFVSMASHEFRTPLTSILSSSEILARYRKQMEDEQIDDKLNLIARQVKHLTQIVDDVLNLGRMQSGRGEFKPVPLDLNQICQEIIAEFQSQPNVEIIYTCQQAPIVLNLDMTLIRKIINNLISNAIKYSPSGKPIHMSLERDGDFARLQVRDEGIGIPPADLNRLFEPFHRANNVGGISGTGLGLAITKEAVERHGGSITVQSEVNTGTTFTVRIPYSSG